MMAQRSAATPPPGAMMQADATGWEGWQDAFDSVTAHALAAELPLPQLASAVSSRLAHAAAALVTLRDADPDDVVDCVASGLEAAAALALRPQQVQVGRRREAARVLGGDTRARPSPPSKFEWCTGGVLAGACWPTALLPAAALPARRRCWTQACCRCCCGCWPPAPPPPAAASCPAAACWTATPAASCWARCAS